MDAEARRGSPVDVWFTILGAGVLGGLVFVGLFAYRFDYAGHFLAGFGGTIGLLVFPLATLSPALRWEPFGAAVVAIAIGAAAEATLFRIAIFDPVDFVNQSLGAVLAAISVQGRPASLVTASGAAVLGLLFLAVGWVLAFA